MIILGYAITAFIAFCLGWIFCAMLTAGARADAWSDGYCLGREAQAEETSQ